MMIKVTGKLEKKFPDGDPTAHTRETLVVKFCRLLDKDLSFRQ